MTSPHGILKRLADDSAGYDIPDPGDTNDIDCDRQFGLMELVTAGAETRALKDPTFAGMFFTMHFKTDGGDCVVTADSAIDVTGNTIITFADANDFITLVSITDGSDTFAWRELSNATSGGYALS